MSKSKQTSGAQEPDSARGSFSGSLGYIMAVAGSAVGLGNIWRFPYLAAKYGGGMFVLIYLVLLVAFGYPLIMSESALGRMTGKSPVGAYQSFGNRFSLKLGGWINAIIPMLIAPYYCVIGGWVIKYLFEYILGNASLVSADGYFAGFMASPYATALCFAVFAGLTIVIVFLGVTNGIEKMSKFMMPILLVLALAVSVYSVTRPGAIEGVKYFLIPDFSKFSFMTFAAALGQMFYSLSIAMGILYTYGSYLKKDVDLEKSTAQVMLFDTVVAVLAGLMIIPAVFAFSGGDAAALNSGPSLMFVTIPKVFDSMGMGNLIGLVFFLMVLFAALTSSISLMETGVSTFVDEAGWSRVKSAVVMSLIILGLGLLCAFGFNIWSFIQPLGMSPLDFFDFITNSVFMPIAAFCTCLLVVKVVGREKVAAEICLSSKFRLRRMYDFSIRYLAPICLLIILASSIANVFGWISF